MLRLSYKTVEDEYKEWIERCGSEKLKLIQEYEQKLKESKQAAANLSCHYSTEQVEEEIQKRDQEIAQLMGQNLKAVNELAQARADCQSADCIRQEYILKISSLENSMIDKIDYQRVQEDAYSKL